MLKDMLAHTQKLTLELMDTQVLVSMVLKLVVVRWLEQVLALKLVDPLEWTHLWVVLK
jgi:hypothetical protein